MQQKFVYVHLYFPKNKCMNFIFSNCRGQKNSKNIDTTQLQNLVQSYSNKDNMILLKQ